MRRSQWHPLEGPFHPESTVDFESWRRRKLEHYPTDPAELMVEIGDPFALTVVEKRALHERIRKTNMALYRIGGGTGSVLGEGKEIPRAIGRQFGLEHLDHNPLADEDGVTSLTVTPGKSGRGFIPYSNQRLLWHTDGYYNSPDDMILGMVLHCVTPAAEGGENALLDHEIAWMLCREANPRHVIALARPDAMTIPAREEDGIEARSATTGPVFTADSRGNLVMRYTARTRSILWRNDPETLAAVRFLEELMASDSPWIFRYRMGPGEGLLCNNVLHNRSAFRDDPDRGIQRLMYRARYRDRISEAGVTDSARED